MGQFKDHTLLIEIAQRIKNLRHDNNLTQDALYNDIGLNISRIESSRSNLSISNLKKICDYFEITLEEFLKDIEITNEEI